MGDTPYQAGICEKICPCYFSDGSVIHSDGYRSYISGLEDYTHEYKSYDPDSDFLYWLHIVISNARAFIPDTCHGLLKK